MKRIGDKIPKRAICEAELREKLFANERSGSMSEWGSANGVTAQQISAFRHGIQTAGLKIPAALGYKPQTIYIPIDAKPISTPTPPRRATDQPSTKVDHTREPVEKPKDKKAKKKNKKR